MTSFWLADFDGLKNLLTEAEEKKFPDSELLQALALAIQEAEKCSSVAQQLDCNRVRTRYCIHCKNIIAINVAQLSYLHLIFYKLYFRTRVTMESKCKLTVEELTLFFDQIEDLACKIKEADSVKLLLVKVTEFQSEMEQYLTDDVIDSKILEKCIENGNQLDIDLPEIPRLKVVSNKCLFLKYNILKFFEII